jgi:hypothetical protein
MVILAYSSWVSLIHSGSPVYHSQYKASLIYTSPYIYNGLLLFPTNYYHHYCITESVSIAFAYPKFPISWNEGWVSSSFMCGRIKEEKDLPFILCFKNSSKEGTRKGALISDCARPLRKIRDASCCTNLFM